MSRTQVKAYDYKVFVTGAFQSGKTTLIHSLDPGTISIERDMKEEYRGEKATTTTGFDLGRVAWLRKELHHTGLILSLKEYQEEKSEYENWTIRIIELRGVPGQLHFRFVRDTMKSNTSGILMMVDSSDLGMIGDATAILAENEETLGGIPQIVIANKQDRTDAVLPETVASWFGIEKTFGAIGSNSDSAKDALISLLRIIEMPLFNETTTSIEVSNYTGEI
jgi:signal recognition particle receptor subunit beta